MTLFLVPAYGRDYQTRSAAVCDWKEGKDFSLTDGRQSTYCSIRDTDHMKEKLGLTKIEIRFASLSKVAVVTL
jgi:hypothetical protein